MQPLRNRQPRRSRAQWKSLIDRHARSGLSGKQFCDREALSYASFVKWRSKLTTKPAAEVKDFIELSAEPLSPMTSIDAAPSEGCLLELQVGSSVTVRIYAGR